MKLFTTDLFRNFGIGFAVGVVVVVAGSGGGAMLAAVPKLFTALF